ncbi:MULTISPECIES: hypothetical protein [unclassified Crossiella]|uniref:hypothetical protein n=1 Tax=unclassified Crossiella TaxID=2620835 RepID=UPI001FFE7977|nr:MULTISPECIES: hypothetical protein [unclassified Crossiella]MCK2241838.1 hypothetical protein [Crossiella sp. S99.2]MCK2255741.1 hypothetical protein [Crossiella sp. S99.1]
MLLFGNRHKLELLAALARAGDNGVNLSDLAVQQGVAASVYYPPINDLLRAGLVDKLPQRLPDRRRWYRRAEGSVWEPMGVLAEGLATIEVKAS